MIRPALAQAPKYFALIFGVVASGCREQPSGRSTTTSRPAASQPTTVATAAQRLPRMGGRGITAEQAAELEALVQATPDELSLRQQLLEYYSTTRFKSLEVRNARVKHVFWIIQNRPDADVAGREASFDEHLEPAAYQQAAKLWSEVSEARKNEAAVLGNAARFFLLSKPEQAEELFKKAQALEPGNPKWSGELGQLYALQSRRSFTGQIDPGLAKKSLDAFEASLAGAAGLKHYYTLAAVARAALDAGELDKAKRYADELLAASTETSRDWNYGNAVHQGNLVLGRIALKQGDLDAAEAYLLKAGATPGSPQLNSFGPNMSLAKELLEQGRKEAVVKYLKACGSFWKRNKLDDWIVLVEGGRTPDFGANLSY